MILSILKILTVFAAALAAGKLVSILKLPSILGWLLVGMALGPMPWSFWTAPPWTPDGMRG